jgi:hypothetical protein
VYPLSYRPGGRASSSPWVYYNSSLTLSFRQHYGPGFDSASNMGEVVLCVGLTSLPLSSADFLETFRASTSCRGKGITRPAMGQLYLSVIYSVLLSSLSKQEMNEVS